MINEIVISLYIVILSFVDVSTYKKVKGYIPSILSTTLLIISFGLYHNTTMAIISALIGLLMTDMSLWKGLADYKVFVALGMTFNSLGLLLIFISLLSFMIIIYSIDKKHKQIPLIPFLGMAWLLTTIMTFI